MAVPKCYVGKFLFVDLSKGTLTEEKPSEQLCREFIGGNGFGIKILYERMKPKADPLGPANILGFVTGPLTATNTPGSGRYTVVAKSPLTGAWGEANSGGFWGPELKWAGYDAVFFSGASPKPVYLSIIDGKAELKDAGHLWGKNTNETEELIKKEIGKSKARVACIGPAGENKSLLAGVVNEGGRIAARSGLGAVMGSKNLKAVVVCADKVKTKIAIADAAGLKPVREKLIKSLKESQFHQELTAVGTGGGLSFLLSIGDSTAKNWAETGTDSMPTATQLDSGNMLKYKLDSYGCHACTIRCGAIIEVKEGPFATNGEVHKPEYETLAALGTMCLNDNFEAVIKANELCNLYGIDTMGVGGAVAFAMECYDKGLITKKDTDGIDLKWGDGAAVVALTEKICKRQGIGALLADGVKKAAEKIGKGAEEYAMHVGGHRLPYHDPRTCPAQAASTLCGAQPSCHMNSVGATMMDSGINLGTDPLLKSPKLETYSDFDKKGPMYTTGEAYGQLMNAAGFCAIYGLFNFLPVAELLAPGTGWDIDWAEGIQVGKRIMALTQAFNVREGITPQMFTMPKRFATRVKAGPAAGVDVDFDMMKKSWFEAMNWDIKSGKPNREALSKLGLDELVKSL